MREPTAKQLIGQAIRKEIAARFAKGDQTVARLSSDLGHKGQVIGLHLSILARMGLVQKSGRFIGRQEVWEKVPKE